MKRILVLLVVLSLFVVGMPPAAKAMQQQLPVLSYKFYPMQDIVFVDLHNPNFAPVDNIVVNMVIREGTGRNRVVAIGQTFLPANLVLGPGEHVSARVPIRARVVRDIPLLAQFEFRISGRTLDDDEAPPDVVVQDSLNGATLEFNRDANGVPMVLGFVQINPAITEETSVQVQAAVLTFLDSDNQIVWSEVMPVGGRLKNNESLMIWAKYEQISQYLVPNINQIDVKFLVTQGNR